MTITKEGTVASFYTVNKAPIKHLKVYFSPQQAGSGDASPNNIREISGWNSLTTYTASKNLASATQVYGILSTCEQVEKDGKQCVRFRANQTGEYTGIKFKENTRYTISMDALVEYYPSYDTYSSRSIFFKFYYTDGTSSANFNAVPSDGWLHLSTTSNVNKTIRAIGAYSTEYRLRTYIDINTFQIEEGTEATSYEPYRGQTIPITFPIIGKNLFSLNPNDWTNSQTYRYMKFTDNPNEDYYLSFTLKDSSVNMNTLNIHFGFMSNEPINSAEASKGYNWIINGNNTIGSQQLNKTIYPTGNEQQCSYLVLYPNTDEAWQALNARYYIQLEKGTTATSYESCTNTVYGGYVDLIGGRGIATHILYNEKWSNWTDRVQTEEIIGKYYDCPYPIKATNTTSPQIKMCNVAKWLWQDTQSTDSHYYIQRTTGGLYRLYMYLPVDFDDEEYVQVILELETPIEYDITPEQLKTLTGTNNIWSNADRVEIEYDLAESNDELYRRRNIILQGAPHLQKASGAIAHFETDMKVPLTSLKVYFEPWMNGYGDPKPDNIRELQGHTGAKIKTSGKNMLKCDTYIDGQGGNITYTKHLNENSIVDYITVTGDNDRNNLFRNLTVASRNGLPQGIFSFNSFSDQANIMPIRQDGMPTGYSGRYFVPQDGGGISALRTGWFDWDITKYDQWNSWVRIQIYPNGGPGTINTIIYPMMCHPSDRGCNFEPYHGQDYQITFPAIKNLLNPSTNPIWKNNSNYTINSNGTVTIAGSDGRGWTSSQITPFSLEKGTYTFSWTGSQRVQFTTSEDNYETVTTYTHSSIDGHFTFTLTNDGGIKWKHTGDSSLYPITCKVQIEKGSTATVYEPYGTVYGGYIDLITGQVMSSWHKFRVKDASWTYKAGNHRFQMQLSSNLAKAPISGWTRFATSDSYKRTDSTNGYNNKEIATFGNNYIYIRDDTYESADDFVEAMGDTEIIYELAEPILVYQFTPQQIKTLIGTNNIWSDLNGNVEITYWTH